LKAATPADFEKHLETAVVRASEWKEFSDSAEMWMKSKLCPVQLAPLPANPYKC
jgi:hypothetical protein